VTFSYEEARREEALWYCLSKHDRLMDQAENKERSSSEHHESAAEVTDAEHQNAAVSEKTPNSPPPPKPRPKYEQTRAYA
jgi:hypothetical protein